MSDRAETLRHLARTLGNVAKLLERLAAQQMDRELEATLERLVERRLVEGRMYCDALESRQRAVLRDPPPA